MLLPSLRRRARRRRDSDLPFDMFDTAYSDAEARRARRMESIYHVGQAKIWDGRDVLAKAIAKHGKPELPAEKRRALARIFGMIMWGELAAWKISAQLADQLEPLEAKLAAASQVHDEARHFYVMHDYLEALGDRPPRIEYWAERVLKRTLGTDSLLKKLVGMQLTVETIALVSFQRVRELEIEPVLTELMAFYERDEARHVGLGVQLVPQLVAELSLAGAIDLAVFQVDLLLATLISMKTIERDLLALGVDPRSLLGIAFRRQADIDEKIRAEFPQWPKDPPALRAFEGLCEVFFPSEGVDARVPWATRLKHAIEVAARLRPSVYEQWGKRAEAARAPRVGLTIPPPPLS
ncbi:MAG TPA: ferritin-like domain-containing protein [Polyangiaceae bacterium]|nr:ferritin-like domain-containing protein [Polyangiaceae bacterium]